MASLEAEALLLGTWKNIEELEDSLNLDELRSIIDAGREREHRHHKFMAAIKGIDLDAETNSNTETKFDEIKRRVESRLTGASEQQLELDVFGLDVESDE